MAWPSIALLLASEMRLPDFLVIGAMKSGTTSLYFDLKANPRIHLPDKELNHLASDFVLSDEGLHEYSAVFAGGEGYDVRGDVSTNYAKLPDVAGVAQRAREVLGPALRIVYLVRDPVARTISHHHHDLAGGASEPDINKAVRSRTCLVDYSRYWLQLTPWIEMFGAEQVAVVRFEDFIAARQQEVIKLSSFLGVDAQVNGIESARAYNRSADARFRGGRLWRLSRSRVYQTWFRPGIPQALRRWARLLLLSKAPRGPELPNRATVGYIIDQVADDVEALSRWVGSDTPLWDLQERLRDFELREPA